MPFEQESISSGFGVPGQTVEQTLSASLDVMSAIEITSSFQNTKLDINVNSK